MTRLANKKEIHSNKQQIKCVGQNNFHTIRYSLDDFCVRMCVCFVFRSPFSECDDLSVIHSKYIACVLRAHWKWMWKVFVGVVVLITVYASTIRPRVHCFRCIWLCKNGASYFITRPTTITIQKNIKIYMWFYAGSKV